MNHPNPNEIQTILDYHFKDESLLSTALTHRSCLNTPGITESYERLEFLGDAILEMLITVYLYTRYPDKQEGYLTAARSAIVRTESLSDISLKYGFNAFIRMSKGEESTGGRKNASTLEDVIESIIGALYIDGGLEVAKTFFERFILPNAVEIIVEDKLKDSKSLLQEKIQAQGGSSPLYESVKETGPDHEKIFEIAAIIENKQISTGTGRNKQEAEQKAAQKALELLFPNTQMI
jgi:ribonuclease-3